MRTVRAVSILGVFAVGMLAGVAMTQDLPQATASTTGQRVCVNNKTGAMRLARIKKCTAGERSVRFGAQGEQGPQGPPGATGAQGPAGDPGTAGSSATVQTRRVTLNYLGSTGLFSSCGSGTSSIFAAGRLYDGVFYDSPSLTSSWNWESVNNCTITLTVVEP